jgi:hypothetical protein
MYDQSKMWRNILLLIFVLLLLTHAVVWVRHADHASATAVSPQAVTVYGQGGSFTSGTVNTGGVSATSLNVPRTTALDSSGDLYVADYTNNRVLYYPAGSTTATRVYGQFGSFTTIVANNNGSGVSGTPSANSLNGPTGLALDSSGNLYIADDANNRMLYFTSGSTTATRVYGQNGSFTAVLINNTGGTANTISATSLYDPNDIALDSSNNLYVADYANNRVLYYASGSTTATRVYGQAGSYTSGSGDNGGVSATSFYLPAGLTLDNSGNLYVSDSQNNRVLYFTSGSTTATRVYGQNGSFTTVLANNTGGTANITSATSLSYPTGLDLDNNGNLYIADFGNSRVLYYAAGSTTATRVYGQGGSFTVGTTNTGGTSATSFYKPFGVTIDSSGNLYVADSTNNRVLQFQTSLSITTQPPSSSPSQGTFSTVASLIDVGSGATFSDFTGTVSAAIKSGTGASGATLGGTISVSASSGVATFSSLYVNLIGSGYILTFSSPGVGSVNTTTTFAITNALGSQAVTVYGQSGSFTTNATTELSSPRNSVTDSSGDLYVADYTNNRVLYYPTGTTTFTSVHGQFGSLTTKVKDNNGSGIASSTPSSGNLYNPSDVALDSSGDLYIADTGNNRVLYYAAGSTTATRVYGQNGSFTTALVNNTGGTANTESATSLNQPFGVGLDSGNNLYVADNANYRVLYYASGSTTATRVYGQNGSFTSKLVNNTSGTANTVSATSLNSPSSVASDSANNLYIADTSNNRVLYYSSGSTTAIRVYGQAGSFTTNTVNNTSGTTGVVSANSLNSCYGINLDSHGDIYVADTSNNRMLEFQTALSITAQPPSIVATGTAFSTTATLIDVGSGATFPDFSGTVAVAIGSGTGGAVLSGTTSVSASSGVATFSNLSINLTGASYTLTLSSSGANSGTTSAFGVLNPAGYWHFDEDSGTSAYDSSGNNNTGTLSATGVTWAAGKINAGLSFNGTKYVTMGTPSTLEFNNTSFSIVSWFNTTTTSTTRIAGSGLSTWNSGFSLGLNSSSCSTGCVAGDLGANGTQANTVLFETTTTFNDGNWHQAVMVIDETAKTAQIYVDGVAQPLSSAFCGTASGTTVNFSSCSLFNTYSTTEPFTVGSYKGTGGTGGYFTGSLDEIRVYGNALSSSQVQTLYTNDVNALSEYAANATFSGTVNSTATYTMPISLTYQLTPAPGWSLLITSTTLTSGTNTMPTTASSITSVAGACATTCTPTMLTNTISSFPMAIPAGTTAPTAVKFFGTAVGTGTGAYTVTPALSVIIPITTRTGTYTSTITLTAATGP